MNKIMATLRFSQAHGVAVSAGYTARGPLTSADMAQMRVDLRWSSRSHLLVVPTKSLSIGPATSLR